MMSKSLKKILVIGASLLMFASVGASTSSANDKRYHHTRTHRMYHHSTWRKGTPSVFHKRSYWVSNFLKGRYLKAFPYIRYAFPMNKNKGINLYNLAYKTKHSKGFPGTDTSVFAEKYPYYKALGHGNYLITCGDSGISHKHGHLYYDLGSNVYLVRMHGRNHLSLWLYNTNSKHHRKYYRGYYTEYAHNNKQLDKVLKTKRFYID